LRKRRSRAIGPALLSDSSQRDLAFRAYGHRRAGDCRDTELIVSPMAAKDAKPKIQTAVNSIRPTGKTPISHSLKESLKDFGGRKGDILLISDGIETCDIDPCELMRQWRNDGVKIRVHVVGVGLNDIERKAMMCVAETGGGDYFDAGSEGEFQEALGKVSKIEPGNPKPIKQTQGYALIIQGVDETGRSFLLNGQLFKDGEPVMSLTSNGRNVLEGPGDYEMEIGPLLKDGTIYKPVRKKVSITERGETDVNVIVTRPAIVSAKFSEEGAEHRGSQVYAYQDSKEIFTFRRFDEVLARPGEYEFRTKPNADNELTETAMLVEGEHTVVEFSLVQTVEVTIKYVLPNGETDQRGGELHKDGKELYTVSHKNPVTVIPGTYELRDKYPRATVMNPLPAGTVITVTDEEKQTIEIPMQAGYILTEYTGEDFDFIKRSGGYTYIHALDADGKSIGSKTASPGGAAVVAKPGRYRVLGHSGKGYFEPVEITVENNKTVTASVLAKPVAAVSMRYAEGAYEREPDRASLVPMDGQKPIKTYMGIGKVLKVPPGRYYIKPHSYTPEAKDTPEFTLKAGETREIIIPRK